MKSLLILPLLFLPVRVPILGQFVPAPFNPGAVAPADTPVITSVGLSTTRNNYTGCVGFSFHTNSNITVTGLGRWITSGNSGTHMLTFTDAAGNSLGSCSLNTNGQTAGTFSYCSLGTPIALSASSGYIMFSQETNGGDLWYDGSATVTSTSAITVQQAEYGTTSGANCTGVGGGFTGTVSYVPVSFRYH